MIERTFQDIPEENLRDALQPSHLVGPDRSSGTTWELLLRSRRVLIISEAGAGKTYECRKQARHLWNNGEPAFFVELAALATGGLRDQLEDEEEGRLNAWLASQSDIATFFLDSIDELKLTLHSFEQSLKRFKKDIRSQSARARIVITTRPVPFDKKLVRDHLPIPQPPSEETPEETFARIAMGDHPAPEIEDDDNDAVDDWRTVELLPLSNKQILEFAKCQGIKDPEVLLNNLEQRNAQQFARRPQDLIELCADWRQHKRIRTHRDQLEANVRQKLQPRDDRQEPAELSVDKAIEGACRLALAMLVTRRLTIRHNVASDNINDDAALDPSTILSDWMPNERKALLERALFGFANYGRVRFHHRSVAEYLAAKRLRTLRMHGMTFRALERLIFANTRNKMIVRPSRRPIAGWLALEENRIFEMLRDHEPAVLLDEGDPESLSPRRRNQALCRYVGRYGQSGWRGLDTPSIQVRRFASPELADTVKKLWARGIENPEVRDTLLRIVVAGRISSCADVAHEVAHDVHASPNERIIAVEAMQAVRDSRLEGIASKAANADPAWSGETLRGVVSRLFPQDLSVEQLCRALSRIEVTRHGLDILGWQLPRLISDAELDPQTLEALRDGLVELLADGLRWREERPRITCDRPHLSSALAATCMRGLRSSRRTDGWLKASVLALRLHHDEHNDSEAHKALRDRLTDFAADDNRCLFWVKDTVIQSLHPIADPWQRLAEIIFDDAPIELHVERDLSWIKQDLADTDRSIEDRAMLLKAAMLLSPNQDTEGRREHALKLKPLVSDQTSLLAIIDDRLKPSEEEKKHEQWARENFDREEQKEQQRAENKTRWVEFWRELTNDPTGAFSPDNSWNTAWKLWAAMKHNGEDSRTSGWSRRFIEEQFGEETADRLRRTLMTVWRQDYPTLPSERAEEERNTYLYRWQLGLAALYAEAEDSSWATGLAEEEAMLAARYAFIELNRLPLWMEDLIDSHPKAVDSVLGSELSWELDREASADGRSMLLQKIEYAPEPVARLFLSRLLGWLKDERNVAGGAGDIAGALNQLRQVVGAILKHGDENTRACMRTIALHRLRENQPQELSRVWLSTLMRVDPEHGVCMLEERLRTVEPEKHSDAVGYFATLFGDSHDGIDLKIKTFTPQLLLRLTRLAYRHVRPADDARREGVYSPDTRYHAEHARNAIMHALLEARGKEGWEAKLEMADDPLCAHFKDRILAVAEEHWAQELDSDKFDETQAVALDKTGEAPGSTNEAMFAIMTDRLEELDELLHQDTSPREAWAGISKEKVMRREVARELENMNRGLYRVDQEAVTAEEKETDIRLRSVVSSHEAVIELKLAEKWSARELRDAIKNQLVDKYMAAETSRSGCLLLTLAKHDRKWKHPDHRTSMGPEELMLFLRNEAQHVEDTMSGSLRLHIHLLDLRPVINK